MKKLSKDSWHYKNFVAWQENTRSKRNTDLRNDHVYNNTLGTWEPIGPKRQPDLCTYTRIAVLYGPAHRVLSFLRKHPRLSVVVWALVYYTVVAVLTGFFTSLSDEYIPVVWALVTPILLATGALCILAVLAVFFYIVDKVQELFRNVKQGRKQGESQPNIVLEYVKARKRKICPLLEFED